VPGIELMHLDLLLCKHLVFDWNAVTFPGRLL